MRITQNMLNDRVLSDLTRAMNRVDRATQEMSTQRKLLRPSDDPVGAQRAVLTRAQLQANEQYRANISQARGWMETTSSTLSEITNLLHRANELLVEGATDSAGHEARLNIAAEIDQIVAAVKHAGNTSYGGVYLFGGTKTTTPPYDTTSEPAVDAYFGDNGIVAREIGPGVSVQINALVNVGTPPLLGGGGGDGGLIDTLRNISAHLRGGTAADAEALRTTDLRALQANLTRINEVQAQVGATLNRLDAAEDRVETTHEAATRLLSDTEDIDAATAILQLTTAQTVYEAALKTGASIIQPSLLDFLR
ncbi:MAG: flagellar hook-associated protein FlgL [Solirubrobacteraceae bacterium]|mgnify:CR=1 FL=1|nr:flagellar hook-associated protein FlgL [Solirubrobacteraceae bacterium]